MDPPDRAASPGLRRRRLWSVGLVAVSVVVLTALVVVLVVSGDGDPDGEPAPALSPESPTTEANGAPTTAAAPTAPPPTTGVSATTSLPAGDPATAATAEEGTCVIDVPANIAVTCGRFRVPEDRADPESAELSLAYVIVHPGGGATHPDPVVYLDGGPGGPGIHPLDLPTWEALGNATGRDVVLFSQRGTYYSDPNLVCFDEGDDEFEITQRCYERLVDEGRRLGAYTSAANAADLADLRAALGYDEWNLLGISYGTRLALTLVRDRPEGIRAVILDGVYPPHVDGYGESAAEDLAALRRVTAACAADAECAADHPDLDTILETVVAALEEEPALVELVDFETGEEFTEEIDGFSFLLEIVGLVADPALAPEIPAIISAAGRGDHGRLFDAGIEAGPVGEEIDTEDDLPIDADGMYQSVQCGEEAPFTAMAVTDDLLLGLLTEQALFELDVCDVWEVPAAGPVENEPVRSDLPTLLFAGEFDNLTPPAWAAAAAAHLSRSFLFEFAGHGHGFSPDSACAVAVIAAFLDDPQTAPAAACTAGLPPVDFADR